MSTFIVAFFKNFILRWFTAGVLEQIVIVCLEKLVKSTKSDIDDEIFETVFKRTEKYKIENGEK